MKLGARIVKTGAAVALSLYVCRWFHLESSVFAALAAALTIQPSLYRSWKYLLEQVQANLIGVSLAVCGVLLLGNHPVVVGLLVSLVIILNLRFKFDKSIPLSIFVVITVTESANGDYLPFAIHRFLLIMIGVLSSMLVNMMFLPPKYEGKLLAQIKETRDLMSLLLRNMIYQEIDRFPAQKKKALDNLKQAEEFFQRFQEEQSYLRKQTFRSTSKVVLFKRMLRVLQKEMETIRTIERHQASFSSVQPDILERMNMHIADLTGYHQQIIGKYEGTIKSHYPHEKSPRVFHGHDSLLRELIEMYDPKTEQVWLHLFPVVAALSELSGQLDHLDKLIEVYVAYHQK